MMRGLSAGRLRRLVQHVLLAPRTSEGSEGLLEEGQRLLKAKNLPGAQEVLQRFLGQGEPPKEQAVQAHMGLAEALWEAGDRSEKSLGHYDQALSLLRRRDFRAFMREARGKSEEQLREEETKLHQQETMVLLGYGTALTQVPGRLADAEARLREAEELTQRIGDEKGLAMARELLEKECKAGPQGLIKIRPESLPKPVESLRPVTIMRFVDGGWFGKQNFGLAEGMELYTVNGKFAKTMERFEFQNTLAGPERGPLDLVFLPAPGPEQNTKDEIRVFIPPRSEGGPEKLGVVVDPPESCQNEPEPLDPIPPELLERLQDLTTGAPIVLFMKGNPLQPDCEWSRDAVEILKEKRIPFSSFDILSDEDVWRGMKTFSKSLTFPQLYAKGRLIGGSDELNNLKRSGKLMEELGVQQ